MISHQPTWEGALEDFKRMRSFQPYKLGGKWFACQTSTGDWIAYRTKAAAVRNAVGVVYWFKF